MITCASSGSSTPPADLNDLIARATQKRWSPVVLLEHLVAGRARRPPAPPRRTPAPRRAPRPLQAAWPISNGTGRSRSIARPSSASSRSTSSRNGRTSSSSPPHGLGKTMLAKNLVHQAILAGHSARFLTAADLILDLTSQDTARALQRRLRTYLATQPARHRRDRLPGLRRACRRPALSSREPALRTEIDRGDHELTLQAMGHRLPECRLRRRPDRSTHASRRDHHDRRGVLSQARGRAGAEGQAGPEAAAHRSPRRDRSLPPISVGPDLRGFT